MRVRQNGARSPALSAKLASKAPRVWSVPSALDRFSRTALAILGLNQKSETSGEKNG
jgi:hypothetical protein